MDKTKILVFGAGPLGSLFAARLADAGHDVALLARGQRLADLREHGIVLHDIQTDTWTTTRVRVEEALAPGEAYDQVMVIMRKNHALEILPVLAANQHTPDVLFLMNNAAGPGELVDALGPDRVLMGFPMAAGYFEGHVIHTLAGIPGEQVGIPFGEVDGRERERTREVARVLDSMAGFEGEIRSDMDAWLKCHVALLMPGLAAALYASGTDNERMVATPDAVILAIRATREGLRVMRALGVPITPKNLKLFERIPEPLLAYYYRRRLNTEAFRTAMVGHAEAARDEVKHLTDEFLALARTTDVPIPAIEQLYPYFDPETPRMPAGQAEIPARWDGVLVGVTGITVVGWLVWRLIQGRFRKEP